MIPILYECTETQFTSNGLGRLTDAISVVVTEEMNGVYECDFEYPVSGNNYEDIVCGRFIACTHDNSGKIQPFEIVSYSRPLDGIVTFHAVHLSYRQTGITVFGRNINSVTDALAMLSAGKPSNPFVYATDKTSTGNMAAADGVPRTVRQMLGGMEGSILETYGGEYEFDKWHVNLWANRGVERSLTIRYGTNLAEFVDETDYSGTYSAVLPYWAGSDGKIRRGQMVTSGASTYNNQEICIPLDLTNKFNNRPTSAQLINTAAGMISEGYKPTQTITIKFADFQSTTEYEDIADLLKCNLCDVINLDIPMYNMRAKLKVVKVVYNTLLDRYDELELGTLSTSLSNALGLSETPVSSVTSEVGTVVSGSLAESKSCSNESGTMLCYITLDPGVWVVTCSIRFPTNATGARRGNFGTTSGATTIHAQIRAVSGGVTQLTWTEIVQPTQTTTYYLNAYQTSGSALTLSANYSFVDAVKII